MQSRKRVYCPHCDNYICKSLFYEHKNLHFDEEQQKWRSQSRNHLSVSFEFSPESCPEGRHEDEDYNTFDDVLACDDDNEKDDSDIETNGDPLMDVDDGVELDFEYVEDLDFEAAECEDHSSHTKIIHVFLLFIFFWQSLFRVSDSAISLLLAFMGKLFNLAAACLSLETLHQTALLLPCTIYSARKFLGHLHENFVRFVVCPTCHALYLYNDSVSDSLVNGRKVSRSCSHVRYPNHVQARMRTPCGQLLLKTVRSSTGSEYLAAFRTYCYKSITSSLKDLLNRPMFAELCEHWRTRQVAPDILSDIYDGQMWQHFQYDDNGDPYLAKPFNFLLMLNCDWFQPFKHTQFSVGVLYVAVQNLPRAFRFKQENVIVVGIMPGPSEPSLNINTYLQPLIEDLKSLWKGVHISVNGKQEKVRAAVSCLSCDVPAARKVGGFVGHRGRRGCSKCLKEFTVRHFGDYPDYSGFDKANWEPRTHALHVWYGLQHKNAKTMEEKKTIESTSGARYSSMFELPYYNPISSCVVDPMHCLFLGIAKTFFKTWVSQDILTEDCFPLLQERVNAFNCPPDIGRIPYKIASKFSGLKADQWKNWTLYFSLYALKDLLPPRDYDCWLIFVKVCHSVCRREISVLELETIDSNVSAFCEIFQQLYGKNALTPNMHFAGHITDCIRDHGPVYAFWLYAFERMNGILGSFHTSNHDVTIQLMRKFISMQIVSLDQWPQNIRSEFLPLFQKCCKESGSLSETSFTLDSATQKPLPPISERAFQDEQMLKIEGVMCSLYPNISIQILRLYRSAKAFVFNNSIKLASKHSRYSNCSKVIIDNKLFEINYFLQCTVIVKDCDSTTHRHWLIHCSPYTSHQCKPWFGYPTQVWSPVLETDFHYFLLNQINSRVVYVQSHVNFGSVIGKQNVLVVTPIPLFSISD